MFFFGGGEKGGELDYMIQYGNLNLFLWIWIPGRMNNLSSLPGTHRVAGIGFFNAKTKTVPGNWDEGVTLIPTVFIFIE